MAKQFHPDRNGHRTEWAAEKTRLLIEAYRILSDDDKRLQYDIELQNDPEAARKRFWDKWEKARREDKTPGGRLRLVLHYLLTGRGNEALEVYRDLYAAHATLKIKEHLSERDYMDCLFLLAEEFERTDEMRAAVDHYTEMYDSLKAKGPRAYLHLEVRGRLYSLLTRVMPGAVGIRNAMPYYEKALKMKLNRMERAYVHKKMAECHLARGERELSKSRLKKAFELKPGLKGAKKIMEKLGLASDGKFAGFGSSSFSGKADD
jgi:tetratricopeptide (TPR) repeat protein